MCTKAPIGPVVATLAAFVHMLFCWMKIIIQSSHKNWGIDMHTRVDIKWEKEPNDKGELVGVAELHTFTADNSFAHQNELVSKSRFAINVSSGCFGMSGMDGNCLPEMSDELRKHINDVATAYWYGWTHARTNGERAGCFLWKLSPDPEWTEDQRAKFGTAWDEPWEKNHVKT